MSSVIEVLWLQVHLAHLKAFLLGCCYRPQSVNSQYLNNMCEVPDSIYDVNREVYFLGDLKIHQTVRSRGSFLLEPVPVI